MHFRLRSTFVLFVVIACIRTSLSATPKLPQVEPAALGVDGNQLQRIDEVVEKAIGKGEMPGCVVLIGHDGGIVFRKAYGQRQIEPTPEPMTVDTVFDLASLTKPVATATSVMLLVERGKVLLGEPVATYLPEFGQNGKSEITVEQLLTHQSGLIPDNPLGDYEHGSEEAWQRIWKLKPQGEPGSKFIYSDVNFLVLGKLVETVSGKPLAEFAKENIYAPLGMTETGFLPEKELRQRAAPSEQRDGAWLKGEVHDPRSALLGGVAGHAGLFSTAEDLAVYAQMMLGKGYYSGTTVLSPQTVADMTRARTIDGRQRALGWDVRTSYSINRGNLLSPRAFGHGGFTGTAMWIDPELKLFVIFLSNRLHPDGEGTVNPLAGRIGNIAAAALRIPPAVKDSAEVNAVPVVLGIDTLAADDFRPLKGKRVGLITNHTGLNAAGERTVDLLHKAPDVKLVALFSPEHGFAGKLDEDGIGDTRDEATGLPVYSLYGEEESRSPTKEQLAGLDVLVFDIQDIGARFYTYTSTMALAMRAAAEQGIEYVVLDRPNPINGVSVAGPMLEPGAESFIAIHSLPVRHGMTIGEIATMINHEQKIDAKLTVIEIKNWRRGTYWDGTGLVWVNPSPNMRSLTQAVLYPGVGMLETTNISVGRGTDTPFELVGAPWIDARGFAATLNDAGLPGVRFVPVRFTPTSSKHEGHLCEGVNLIITDRDRLEPVRMGFTIAATLRQLYADEWDTKNLRLIANERAIEGIRAGASAETIEAEYAAGLNDFRERRAEFLMYR
jgi:uncharacterized protein YbbC (DUF1343 family)/CubicO group peptidase (beta-lactamase class C family)